MSTSQKISQDIINLIYRYTYLPDKNISLYEDFIFSEQVLEKILDFDFVSRKHRDPMVDKRYTVSDYLIEIDKSHSFLYTSDFMNRITSLKKRNNIIEKNILFAKSNTLRYELIYLYVCKNPVLQKDIIDKKEDAIELLLYSCYLYSILPNYNFKTNYINKLFFQYPHLRQINKLR